MLADQRPAAIIADDVDIRYRVYEEPHVSARYAVSRGFRTRRAVEVHAVRGISFEVGVGEALGIIGSNGSGKSTLLRAVAGLQSLHGGRIQVRGEIGLLGVGAALMPTLSGYRNVMLGGLALGLTEREVEARMDEVIEFSGLGEAMGRPLRTYSSGMRARLAFSISTLKVPDILLIDEALAVGDKQFKARSLERLNQIRDTAGTIVMVTHSLGEIKATCDRAIWLEEGIIRAVGSADEIVDQYEQQ